MSKRSHGEGSITYDKTRDRYRAFISTPDGGRISKRFKTEKEAVMWKTDQLSQMNKGVYVQPNDIKVGEWLVEWLTLYKKDTLKQTTYERYVSLAKHVSPIANMKLQDVKPVHVQKMYQDLTNISACTINKVHKLLKDAYNKAYELELVKKNIMSIVKSPKYEKKEIEIFTHDEVEKILKTCQHSLYYKKYYPIILLLAKTGARRGEILGLRWCDVLFDTGEIFIRQELQQSEALGIYIDTPKTKASIRKVSITQDIINELKALKTRTKNIDIKQQQLCFLTKNGTPYSPRNYTRVWERLMAETGIPYRKMHTLRHTHATELLAANVPLTEVSRRLGHAKSSHTLELYGHSTPNYDKKIVEKIEQLYPTPK